MADEETRRVAKWIGANITGLRIKAGISQERLAAQIDREPNYLQKVEYGTTVPSLEVIVRLATALDVRPAVLLKPARQPSRRRGRPARKAIP